MNREVPVKTVWLLIAVSILAPGMALGQSDIAPAQPGFDPRMTYQTTQPSIAPAPESVPPGAASSAPACMTLAELEAMALANNPAMARASARIDAARGNWVQVGLPPNPVAGYAGAEIGDEGRAGQQGAFLGQEIIMGGKLRLNRAVASQEIAQMEQQAAAQRYRVLSDVRISYYEVLIAQRTIDIANALRGIGNEAVKAVEGAVKAQETSRGDLLQARVETNTARIILANAQNQHIAAWRRLSLVVGAPNMVLKPLAGNPEEGLPEIQFEVALQRLLMNSPELAANQAGVERARAALARARAEPIPNVDFTLTGQHDNATGSDIIGVQIGIPIPVLNRNQGGIQRAEAEYMAAEAELRRTAYGLQQRLATVYQQYASTRQQAEVYQRDILPDARGSLDIATKGYRQGEFSYLTLLTAQRTYFQTNLSYLESLRVLRESSVTIEGFLLRDSLQSVGDPQP